MGSGSLQREGIIPSDRLTVGDLGSKLPDLLHLSFTAPAPFFLGSLPLAQFILRHIKHYNIAYFPPISPASRTSGTPTSWFSKGDVTRDDSQQRFLNNTALQHCYYIVLNGYNIVPTFEPCVALKIVIAHLPA